MHRIENLLQALETEAQAVVRECDELLVKFVAPMREYLAGKGREARKRAPEKSMATSDKQILARRELALNLVHGIREAQEKFRTAKQDPASFGYAMLLVGRNAMRLSIETGGRSRAKQPTPARPSPKPSPSSSQRSSPSSPPPPAPRPEKISRLKKEKKPDRIAALVSQAMQEWRRSNRRPATPREIARILKTWLDRGQRSTDKALREVLVKQARLRPSDKNQREISLALLMRQTQGNRRKK